MKRYNRWNNIVGWAVFAVAALTYLATMEPSASLWDCSEFIATSYKLEVGHPPGAPLFMMMARLATMLAPSTEYVPLMVNAMNSLASAFCILFMFWTVTHLGRRIYSAQGRELTDANMWTVLGAGAVGALAYTFTDTFWFSAYEGEVYALSSMFTALVVWLMLKWEDQADEPHATRWLILIAYLMGLSIGIHILNLLTVPALVYIYYFRKYATVTFKGFCIASVIAGDPLVHQRIDYPLHGLHRGDGRRTVRQYVRPAGQLGHHPLRTVALRPARVGVAVHPPPRPRGGGCAAAGHHDDPAGIQFLRYGRDPRGGQSSDEQQRPVESPCALLCAQPRPVRRPAAALRRLLLGAGRKRRRVDALLHRRRRPLCHGLLPHRLHTTRSSSHLFPACGTTPRAPTNTNSGQPTAPRWRRCATSRATSCATRKGSRCAARCSTTARSAPTTTATPSRASSWSRPFGESPSSSLGSTTCTGAISCGTSSAARATSSPPVRRRSPTATGCRESTRSTASTWGRRRICRAKWLTTKRATPTISYPSSWASSG